MASSIRLYVAFTIFRGRIGRRDGSFNFRSMVGDVTTCILSIFYFQEQFQFCHEVVLTFIQQFNEYSNFSSL